MTDNSTIHAIVTGGASGLGYATAEAVVSRNGRVAILNTHKTAGESATKQLGKNAIFIETDVSNEQQVDSAIKKTIDVFGNINLVVNCAGIAPSQRVLGKEKLMSAEDFNQAIAVNLQGTFNVIRAATNVMQRNQPQQDGERGVIINTASIAAFDGQVGQAAYAASKGGIVSMTLPLAREFARIGVRVVTIAPGLFKTPLFDNLPEKAIEALKEQIPFPKRIGDPSEFAKLVLHIVENKMINGETIRLDGALRM